MNLETSTLNVLLGIGVSSIIALQAWTVREQMNMKSMIASIAATCPYCRKRSSKLPVALAAVVLIIALLLLALEAGAASTNYFREQVSLAWDASPSADVTSYQLYWGTNSGSYTLRTNVGNVLTGTITLPIGTQATWYFACTALDNLGQESIFSNEVAYTPSATNAPAPPEALSVLTVTVQRSTNLTSWTSLTNFQAVFIGTTNGVKFYRSVLSLSP